MIMKEHLENGKKFIIDHKYEFTVGLIATAAIGALAAVKIFSTNNVEIDATDVDAIEDVPDDGNSASEE